VIEAPRELMDYPQVIVEKPKQVPLAYTRQFIPSE
jgi:hypothetical protein